MPTGSTRAPDGPPPALPLPCCAPFSAHGLASGPARQGDKVRALVRSPDKVVVPPGSGGEARSGQPLTSTDLTVQPSPRPPPPFVLSGHAASLTPY